MHLAISLAAALAVPQAPGPSHRLGISPSGHYLTLDGRAVVLVGDSGTQCVMQNANLDYHRWVADCADRGLNAVHIWSFVPPRQKADGSAVEARYGYVYPGLTPWARAEAGPLAADGLPLWDLRHFDEGDAADHYWPRLRDLCRLTAERDIVLGITVFFGWPKHRADWEYHPLNVTNGGPVRDDGNPITQAQVIASPGTEVLDEDWDDAWPTAKQTQWIWERFADKLIRETAPYGNVFLVFMDEHSYSEGNCGDHFAAFFRQRGALWCDWDHRRDAVDLVMSPTVDGADKHRGVARAFGREPAKPYVFLEGPPYRGPEVRVSLWSTLLGGGHFFFHADADQETPQTGIMGYDSNVPGGDRGMDKRDWLGHASRFFAEQVLDLDSTAPHDELARGGHCLAAPALEYVVYAAPGHGGGVEVDLSGAPGECNLRLLNPRTGELSAARAVAGGQWQTIDLPDGGDWVVHIRTE